MKKIFVFLVLLFCCSAVSRVDMVYICNSKGGKRYHYSKDCRGLSNCKSEIKEITLEQARKDGKTLCGYEK